MSMLGLARATVRLFQNPTGTIGAAARAMLEFLYSGIPLALPPVTTPRVITGLIASRSTTVALGASRSTAMRLSASRSTTVTLTASET